MLHQRWVFLLATLLAFGIRPGLAQSGAEADVFPVRLIEVYAPSDIVVGEVVNFRVRASNGTPRPFTALWDFDNGYLSVGNPVAHAYTEPGIYTVRVIGRNRASADTLTIAVTVTEAAAASERPAPSTTPAEPVAEEPAAEPAPEAPRVRVREASLRGSAALTRSSGTYTWVIASDLWRERLEASVLHYRLQNLRAEVYQEPRGKGSPVYRIVVGEFETEAEARAARAWLPPDVQSHAHLMVF